MQSKPPSWLELVSRRWWFYLVILLLFFAPAYTTRPFNPAETPALVLEVLSHALAYRMPALFPVFKLVPLLLVVGLAVWGRRMGRIFLAWASFNLMIIALFQNAAETPSYGFAVITGNVLVYGLLAGLFGWAALAHPGQGTFFGRALWQRGWVIPLAALAWWFPAQTGLAAQAATAPYPDFSLRTLLANEAGLTFCMMLPVFLAVLVLAFPDANRTLLRVGGFIGALTGLLNVIEFLLQPGYGWWMAILHLPLLVISLYAFWLGIRK